ncbi:MAG: hypothetical protein MK359_03125 [SAR202 cluster bacterium]|nr:hypothetical protein [SAR202 cluster bacterium]
MSDPAVIFFAFFAGVVAAFNPCGAAMFPAFVGYQLEVSKPIFNPYRLVLYGLKIAFITTLGFILVFSAIGILLGFTSWFLIDLMPFLGLGVGLLIFILGLFLLVSKKKFGILVASRVNFSGGKGIFRLFLFGVGYAAASLSCALPVFVAAIGVTIGKGPADFLGFAEVFVATFVYALGMGTTILFATIGVISAKGIATILIKRVFPYFEVMGNLLMVFAGIYLIYYWLFGTGQALMQIRLNSIF